MRKLVRNKNNAAKNIRNDLSDERISLPYFRSIKIAAMLIGLEFVGVPFIPWMAHRYL
jgi:hypothetical protein